MLEKFWLFIFILLTGCAGDADKYPTVTGFEVNRYLGTWYEIARFDHSLPLDAFPHAAVTSRHPSTIAC